MTIYKLRFVGNGEFIVISPQILQRLIGKVMESSKREAFGFHRQSVSKGVSGICPECS